MSHYEVGLKLRHDCPINDFSREHPSAVVAQWTDQHTNLFEISVEDERIAERFAEDLENSIAVAGGRLTRKIIKGSTIQLIVRCNPVKRDYSNSRVFGRHNCLELLPMVYADGWEWYRVLVFSKSDLRSLLNDLDEHCKVEIVSKKCVEEGTVKDTMVISSPSLIGGLTGYQAEALLLALNNGYYNAPRSVTTEKVASRVGLSRSTFEEHLRKAESKVLQSVAPYILLSAAKRKRNHDRRERTPIPPYLGHDYS